ncbi:MAG: XdhC family protein [Pseudomonadota bacterium]
MLIETVPFAGPVRDPIDVIMASSQDAVLAIITGVEGPSYRPVGAFMAVFEDGSRAGTLSSGCIEADIGVHAREALATGRSASVRYGRGSPFIDIQLPCGGGLDILLLPRPDRGVLEQLAHARRERRPVTLAVVRATGALELRQDGATGWHGEEFLLRETPAIRFLVFGKGPEAATFAALVQGAGYPNRLLSPDPETIGAGAAAGCPTQALNRPELPEDLNIDPWTAVILFFHDHDWEPPILAGAIETDAFYIGAQGSQRARDARLRELHVLGADPVRLQRLHGPVGLIPSARDSGTLAVSVLAEILQAAMAREQ